MNHLALVKSDKSFGENERDICNRDMTHIIRGKDNSGDYNSPMQD